MQVVIIIVNSETHNDFCNERWLVEGFKGDDEEVGDAHGKSKLDEEERNEGCQRVGSFPEPVRPVNGFGVAHDGRVQPAHVHFHRLGRHYCRLCSSSSSASPGVANALASFYEKTSFFRRVYEFVGNGECVEIGKTELFYM